MQNVSRNSIADPRLLTVLTLDRVEKAVRNRQFVREILDAKERILPKNLLGEYEDRLYIKCIFIFGERGSESECSFDSFDDQCMLTRRYAQVSMVKF